ncbi:MAG: group II intron reverse transcriptase/maturase, partial [Candidatus Binataceae bacterium]
LVEIPKANGGTRPLGIPTVADRIAQMVVTQILQPILEPQFHADSYGYRLGKSAKEAVGVARRRCWEYDWVLDLDIKAFFETIDQERLMRAVKHHTTCPWVLLYIQRWLRAPTQLNDGTLIERTRGTPQGGVISPILANLFLHYAFDLWMNREHPGIRFERYADDVICHLRTEKQAILLKESIAKRFMDLELHPQKTLIAYCKDGRRKAPYPKVHFTFLGFMFRPRLVKDKRSKGVFVGFTPAVSPKAALAIRQEMRSWLLSRRSDLSIEEIARTVNPAVRGWINYYGAFYRSALYRLFEHLDDALVRWAMRKFKDLSRCPKRARAWVVRLKVRHPRLFAHWALLPSATG